jgi:excisionase family DNA binding protein
MTAVPASVTLRRLLMTRGLLSPAATGEEFDVCAETLRRLYRDGRIPGYKVGRHLKFDPDEVREALRSGPNATHSATPVEPDFDALDAA